MDYLIHRLLDENQAKELSLRVKAEKNCWLDGKNTAGSYASKVKNNFQLDRKSAASKKASEYIISKIISDPLLKSFSIPSVIHGVMFTKSKAGNGYGMHVDNPYMSSGRSDLSFTLFLSSKDDYIGGELSIQTAFNNNEIKLSSGEIIIYPSTSLHEVNKVKKGERLVCVGWIQSYIKSNEDRSILFNLEAGAKGMLSKYGRSAELDLIFQAYSNLSRRLGD